MASSLETFGLLPMPKTPKRPRDFSQAAKLVVDIASGQVEDREPTPEEQGKDSAAVSLGRRGGLKGGKAPWADIPERYGPHTTCMNRFNRWRKAGVWDRLLEAVSKAYDGDIQMIDSPSIRVHQHAANAKKRRSIRLHGPLAGRPDDKDPCACRCRRPAACFETDRRPGP